ncbi:MAG: tetratricopeptide repeat protein [Deltaproteobacteria bacterium]|nr:tetratricopeptide repeat protein [Deltaproteobacteria bacterium]
MTTLLVIRSLSIRPALVALVISIFAVGTACHRSDPLAEIKALHADGRIEASLEPLRELLAEDPENPEVLYLYGLTLHRIGTATQALWALRTAMEDPEWLKNAGMLMAKGALNNRDFTVAIEACNRVLAAHPDDVDALLLRARSHAAAKLDFEQALADAERVLELEPDHIAARDPQILALLGLGRIDEAGAAMNVLGEAIGESDLSPSTSAWHCATMAIFANDGGKLELAQERWTKCLELHPSDPEVVTKALTFYEGRSDWARAIEILRAAMEDAPREMAYRIGLAERLRAFGQNDEAEDLLRAATEFEATPAVVTAWLGLVTHFQALGEYSAAAEAAGRALEAAKRAGEPPPRMFFDYADSLVLAGELDRALEVSNDLSLEAHKQVVLARVTLAQGNAAEALEYFSKSFLLWPDNAITRYYAAVAAEELGAFDRAIEEYRYSIRIDPGATDARVRLGRLHDAEGKRQLALQVLVVQTKERPLGQEGDLLLVNLYAQLNWIKQMLAVIERLRTVNRVNALAVVSAADGLAVRGGPERALEMLTRSEGIELEHPRDVAALRAWIRYSYAAGRGESVDPVVERAVSQSPSSASLHAARGLARSLRGAPADEVRAAYARALELNPGQLEGLVGLGRLELASGDAKGALSIFERAIAVSPLDLEAMRGRASALITLDRSREADRQLEALLREHPFDTRAALLMARRAFRAGGADERTLELASRAARFGGGLEAVELLAEIYAQRGDRELASKLEARARGLHSPGAASPL